MVHLVDIPGFLIGKEAEASGVMRFGTQALAAVRNSTVPWCARTVRKAFGMAALSQRNGSPAFLRYAWPSAQWGSPPIAGGVDAAYRAVIEAAPDPAAKRAEIEARLEALQSPLRTAEAFGVEEIISPPPDGGVFLLPMPRIRAKIDLNVNREPAGASVARRRAVSETKTLKVRVDPDKCQGHNRCKAVAPDLFRLDEYGNAREVGDGTVPPGQEEKAYLAKSNCPEFAIEIVEE